MYIENQVNNLLHYLNIEYPHQIDVESIAHSCKAEVYPTPIRSHCTSHPYKVGWSALYIQEGTPEPEWRYLVAHELCHHVLHVASHLEISPLHIRRHEIQAKQFADYLLVPLFMFNTEEIHSYVTTFQLGINWVIEQFNVTKEVARRRWNAWHNKALV